MGLIPGSGAYAHHGYGEEKYSGSNSIGLFLSCIKVPKNTGYLRLAGGPAVRSHPGSSHCIFLRHTHGAHKLLSQGSNPCHNRDPHHTHTHSTHKKRENEEGKYKFLLKKSHGSYTHDFCLADKSACPGLPMKEEVTIGALGSSSVNKNRTLLLPRTSETAYGEYPTKGSS